MILTRRRFLSLSACAFARPGFAAMCHWSGRAFGADVSIQLDGPMDQADTDLRAVVAEISRLETLFSLFSESSELSRLNEQGHLAISPEMWDILSLSQRVHRATDGLFDPTVQTLWRALAEGGDVEAARARVDFSRLVLRDGQARLGPGQMLSLNGIAQGFATDRIARMLKVRGYEQALINIGEFAALGGPYRLGLADPNAGRIGQVTLRGAALATSSPATLHIGDMPHILHPKGGEPIWSTVSVEAETAALADACSTAMCLMRRDQIASLRVALGLKRVILVDENGDLTTL